MRVDMKCNLTFYPRRRLGIISTLANGIKLKSRTWQEAEASVDNLRTHLRKMNKISSKEAVEIMTASESAWRNW